LYKGESIKGVAFYNLLYANEEFCAELGKVALPARILEAELIKFLNRKGIKQNIEKATLRKLISVASKNHNIDINMIVTLKTVRDQRNYLTHNIYTLFLELIDETILERSNLLDSDVHLYIERAWQLKENLNGLADIFEKEAEST
jgi:hypothetical protein